MVVAFAIRLVQLYQNNANLHEMYTVRTCIVLVTFNFETWKSSNRYLGMRIPLQESKKVVFGRFGSSDDIDWIFGLGRFFFCYTYTTISQEHTNRFDWIVSYA